jgi:large subunit ribosomal protein L25
MAVSFALDADERQGVGTGANRRLRRSGKVPGILYGGAKDPVKLALSHNEIVKSLRHEAFFSHLLTLNVGGKKEQAILRDVQRHPYKAAVLHVDFQRVVADEALTVNVPLHYINEEDCAGVKLGGAVSHIATEVAISCLPKDLPEYIDVDLMEVGLGESVKLSDIRVPAGVELVELSYGSDHDVTIATVHAIKTVEVEEAEEGEEGAEGSPAGEG